MGLPGKKEGRRRRRRRKLWLAYRGYEGRGECKKWFKHRSQNCFVTAFDTVPSFLSEFEFRLFGVQFNSALYSPSSFLSTGVEKGGRGGKVRRGMSSQCVTGISMTKKFFNQRKREKMVHHCYIGVEINNSRSTTTFDPCSYPMLDTRRSIYEATKGLL